MLLDYFLFDMFIIVFFVDIVYENGVKVVVDNIFLFIIILLVCYGVDVVVYSMMKFISGFSDIIVGVVCGLVELVFLMMGLY